MLFQYVGAQESQEKRWMMYVQAFVRDDYILSGLERRDRE
jgi:hypothetical protein